MKVRVNGKQEEFVEDLTIAGLIAVKNVQFPTQVSVELNGDILERREFDTKIKEGDAVEFLYFMGGGSSWRDSGPMPL